MYSNVEKTNMMNVIKMPLLLRIYADYEHFSKNSLFFFSQISTLALQMYCGLHCQFRHSGSLLSLVKYSMYLLSRAKHYGRQCHLKIWLNCHKLKHFPAHVNKVSKN
jgi:hypothetical protein